MHSRRECPDLGSPDKGVSFSFFFTAFSQHRYHHAHLQIINIVCALLCWLAVQLEERTGGQKGRVCGILAGAGQEATAAAQQQYSNWTATERPKISSGNFYVIDIGQPASYACHVPKDFQQFLEVT